eukprot:2503484-Amphidinium_carterae.1
MPSGSPCKRSSPVTHLRRTCALHLGSFRTKDAHASKTGSQQNKPNNRCPTRSVQKAESRKTSELARMLSADHSSQELKHPCLWRINMG